MRRLLPTPSVLAAAMGPGVCIGCGDGAGSRRDKYVCKVQTCAQTYGHGDRGLSGTADQCLTDRVQDNEAGVTENRNGNDPAHQLQCQDRMVFSNQVDDHVSQLQGSTRHFQDRADQCAQDNDDTDAGESPRESGTDDRCNTGDRSSVLQSGVHDRDPCHKPQDQGDSHDRNKGMDLELGDCNDHQNNSYNKCDNKRKTSHRKTPFIKQTFQKPISCRLRNCSPIDSPVSIAIHYTINIRVYLTKCLFV